MPVICILWPSTLLHLAHAAFCSVRFSWASAPYKSTSFLSGTLNCISQNSWVFTLWTEDRKFCNYWSNSFNRKLRISAFITECWWHKGEPMLFQQGCSEHTEKIYPFCSPFYVLVKPSMIFTLSFLPCSAASTTSTLMNFSTLLWISSKWH